MVLDLGGNIPSSTVFRIPEAANNQQIPQGEELAVHFQVHHLQKGGDGRADFTIEYEITQDRRMQGLLGRDREVSLSFSQQIPSARHVQNLSIPTRELEPGAYTLHFKVIDQNSGQQTQREIELEIIEEVQPNQSS